MIVEAFQTLEDRDNIDQIELEGPFKCTRKDAWLGEGYYFWDSDIDWAKDWGDKAYKIYRKKDFVIARCQIDLSNKCFDLFGNVNHKKEFENVYKVMKEDKKTKDVSNLTVPNIIEFLRRNGLLDFNSIRSFDNPVQTTLFYNNRSKERLILGQRVQICVINKKDVILRPFSVVYPEKYYNLAD